MEYKMLKEKYNKFIYKNFEILEDNENIYLKYYFEIQNLCTFSPNITIPKKEYEIFNLNTNLVKNIAFHIGMIESISYWKSTCSEYFYIECGKLSQEQIEWFKKLIYFGLGEFRFVNNIKSSQADFIKIISNGNFYNLEKNKNVLNDVIIPIGGGKDSNVTLELLKKMQYKRFGFRINQNEVSYKCAKIAGLLDNEIIEVTRKIDPELITLNKKGFLNGHTPFSALVAFLTYFVATIFGKKYIVLSNEDSSNESNVKGENINHQYSKTIEFENDFRNYVKKFICINGPEYFSFLRPISEIQIAKLFSELEEYHKVFKSCNVGSKSTPWKWCCECPKCLFAFIILSPFLYKEKLIDIFGKDLFEKENLLQIFKELCGYENIKPFECVGTYQEIRYAISETIRKNKSIKLPFMLQYYKDNFEMIDLDILNYYNNNNNLPYEFEKVLKESLKIK